MITFAHFSDCHIGGWKEDKLRSLSIASFEAAVQKCIERKVDFVVISGDLFNTSVPSIDALKMVATGMKKLHVKGIRVYAIPGSHDYSPSGKTMLEVLERSGLCTLVFKFDKTTNRLAFTVDEPTGVKLAGMVGLRGGLERFDYMKLDKTNLEQEGGVKVFLFHSLITEFKPMDFEHVESEPLMSLPKNFTYYAGGHPHFVFQRSMFDQGYGLMTYPGPLFPNNFKELEQLRHGGFYIVTLDGAKTKAEHVPLPLKNVISIVILAEGKRAQDVKKELEKALRDPSIKDAIVTVRVEGCLSEGSVGDIPFSSLFDACPAYATLKNTYKLTGKEIASVEITSGSVGDVEQTLITHHAPEYPVGFCGQKDSVALVQQLMALLDKEKLDGERISDFDERILSDVIHQMKLKEIFEHAD
jgi:DNA repair exonuclease SbcCD nuclease subunit